MAHKKCSICNKSRHKVFREFRDNLICEDCISYICSIKTSDAATSGDGPDK